MVAEEDGCEKSGKETCNEEVRRTVHEDKDKSFSTSHHVQSYAITTSLLGGNVTAAFQQEDAGHTASQNCM